MKLSFLMIVLAMALSGTDSIAEQGDTKFPDQKNRDTEKRGNQQKGKAEKQQDKTSEIPAAPAIGDAHAKKNPDKTAEHAGTKLNEWFNWFEAFGPKTWSNWVLVLVGFGAACIAVRSLGAIRQQADTAVRTLALTQRPRIKVRSLAVNDNIFEPGERGFTIDLGYEVVNYGGTDAIVTDSNCTILLRHVSESSDLPSLPRMTAALRIKSPNQELS